MSSLVAWEGETALVPVGCSGAEDGRSDDGPREAPLLSARGPAKLAALVPLPSTGSWGLDVPAELPALVWRRHEWASEALDGV